MMSAADDRAPKRIGVLGGTFDPIHIGHLAAATEAVRKFDLDRVLFVPAGEPWQKERYSAPEDRYLMTVLGTEGQDSFSASRLELDRRGPTYTADTIDQLRGFYGPDARLYFIAGADAVLRLGTWRHLDRLAGEVEMIAISRSGSDLGDWVPENTWPQVHVVDIDPVDVSASDIRERVKSGEAIEEMVPASVLTYIRARGLYV